MNSHNEHSNLRGGVPRASKTGEEIRFAGSLRYALAILFVGAALGVGLLFQNFHFRVPATALLLFAVAIVSWKAGRGPAVLAVILATISCYWFFVEPDSTIYINYSEIPYFIIFTGFAVLLCWFGTIRRRIEADLRQSRDVLWQQASLLSLTHDAVYVRDMKGVVSYWNCAAEMLYGWPREHALGKLAHELLKTNFPLPLERIEAELLRAGRWEGELVKTKKDGVQVVVASRWSLKRDDRGAPVAILVTSNDVTERKRAEAELRASEERFRTLVQFSFDVYWESDAQHRFTRQEFAEGLADAPAPGSEIGKTRWEVPYLEPDEAAWRQHRATLNAHLPFRDFELARPAPDGGKRYVSVSGLPVFDATGRFTGYRGVGRHITDRKRAEQALRESEAYLTEAQRLSHTGSWAFDLASDKYVYASEECLQIFEFDAQGGLPTRESVSRLIHPEDWDRVKGDFETSLRDKVDTSSEFRIALPSGTVKHIQAIRHPVLNDAGDVVKLVGTVIDLTERKRAEEERQRHLWFLESLDRINRAMQGSSDLERMLSDVLGAVLSIFACDRAWLVYPCDPEAASWKVPMEHTRPEFPGAFALGLDLPVAPEIAQVFQAVRASSGPVRFGPGSASPLPPEVARRFSIQSMLGLAIYPKGERPYMLGLHQCSHPRVWTPQEERLFQETGRRLADALTSVLIFRSLRESERRLEEAQRIAHVGYWDRDLDAGHITLSDEGCRIFGLQPEDRVTDLTVWHERWQAVIHPEDRPRAAAAAAAALAGGPRYDVEYRVVHRTGEVRIVHSQGDVIRDESGRPCRMFGIMQDITDRKRAEAELRASEERFRTLVQFSFDVYWETDAEHRFTRQEFATGLTDAPAPGSEIGKMRWEIPYLEPDEETWRQHRATLDAHLPFRDFELARPTPDGGKRYVSVSGLPVFDETGRFLGYRGVGRHITDRKRAQEALRQSQAYLAEAQRLSHTGSWAFDVANNKYVYVSEECARIFELDAQEDSRTREAVARLIHPEDWPRVNEAFENAIRDKVDTSSEFRITLPSATVKHVQAIRHPVLNEAGDVVQLVGTVIDITERKGAEEALRRTGAYLAEAQRLAHTGSWAWNPLSEQCFYWSEEMFRIFEIDPRQGLPTSETFWQRIHPEDRESMRELLGKSALERTEYVHEHRILLPDGTVKHIHTIGHPVLDEAGKLVEYVGTAMDITERKLAEDALRESETRFRTFVDHAADAFFMLDCEQGAIVDVNRGACESLGYTRQDLVGMTAMAFHLDSDRAQMESVAERAVAGETVVDTHRHRRKDGSMFPVEVHTNLVSYGGRRFLLKVARDISDRVRAEEQRDRLRQLEADLAHINRVSLMGELTASIAHEVNQPLAGVVGNAGACLRWLAGDVPNLEEAREAARRIVRDGKRAGEIIARVRALTRRAATPQEKLDLNETIRDVLALVDDEAKRRSAIIHTRFADDLAPVAGDRVQLQQVVLNLVMNGIEAMSNVSDRGRELVITTRNADPNQGQVTVEDSGTGLDPNAMDKIFDPFYTTKPGGMGMGLSISRSIIEAHGGRLWATAKDGPGTLFHFTLPTYPEEGPHA